MKKHNDRYAFAHPLPYLALVSAGLAVIAWGALFAPTASAQGVNVQITELDCNGDPELVVISNLGDATVEMTGWNLQSDPTGSQSIALAQFGSLSPDETLMVKAGPSAGTGYVWSTEFVFRDNDPSDFAQLASDAGDVLVKVNCAGPAQPSATALPAVNAPSGGGAPAAAAGVPPAVLIALGSGLFTVGMGTFAVPVLGRLRRRKAALEEAPEPEAEPAPQLGEPSLPDSPPATATIATNGPGMRLKSGEPKPLESDDPLRPFLFLAIIVLAGVAILLFLLQTGETKRE